MNSQTAITLLKNLEQCLDSYCELNDEGKTAFSMAITALELFGISEQLPSVHPELSNNSPELDIKNGELISRQAAIDVEGIDEQIRCEMCRNPMHTDRGCDGNCKYDEKLYERIMQILGERIKPFPEPRKGKWIRTRTMTHDGELYCDQCEQEHPEQKIIWNFCPNCGCRMEEGDSDEKD